MKALKTLSRSPINAKLAKELLSSGYVGIATRAMDKKQYEVAKIHFEKILELNISETDKQHAFENLGKIFEQGLTVKQDLLKADEYYLRAGSRGNRGYLHKVAIKSIIDRDRTI